MNACFYINVYRFSHTKPLVGISLPQIGLVCYTFFTLCCPTITKSEHETDTYPEISQFELINGISCRNWRRQLQDGHIIKETHLVREYLCNISNVCNSVVLLFLDFHAANVILHPL